MAGKAKDTMCQGDQVTIGDCMQTLRKHTKPTKYDLSLPRTIWEEISEDPNVPNKFYIQISDDSTESEWLTLGEFFERSFDDFKLNEGFLEDVFALYKRHNSRNSVIDMIHAVALKKKGSDL